MKEEYNIVLMEYGNHSVTILGVIMMHILSVGI